MVTRRTMLRGALAGAAVAAWPTPLGAAMRPTPTSPLVCDLQGSWSRSGTDAALRPAPFTTPLPRPPELGPGGTVELTIGRADVELLPGTRTPMLTYNGSFPGPTIRAIVGEPLEVVLQNGLEDPAVLHLHGVHAAARDDGHVRQTIAPGASRAFSYPGDQRPALLWYHDHLLMHTAERVYRGLAGLYVLTDPAERSLGLPVADERDISIVLTEKAFAEDGTLVYDTDAHLGFAGDVTLVNGADRPLVEVGATPVRLRVLNASNARPIVLVREDGHPLVQIATDGGLLAASTPRPRIEVWPAERVELLVDLTGAEVGTTVTFRDDTASPDEPGLVRLEVVEATPSTGGDVAGAFPALEELGTPEVTRTITLDRASDGRFLLNGHGYDDDTIDVYARLGAVERWRLVNTSPANHPVHLHLVTFQVARRLGATGQEIPLRPEDEGWKDVVVVRSGETVEVDARFADHLGDFMYHCHVLEHEDHDMMSQFRVVDLSRAEGRNRVETSAALAALVDGPVDTVAVATGLTWHSALAGAAVADALLLVTGPALDPAVRDQLVRLRPRQIVVVGDDGEVSSDVEAELATLGAVRRVAGVDAAGTAAAVATELVGTAPTVVLATDRDFPDALAAGTLGVPVLLTDPAALSAAAAEAMDRLGAEEVVIAGGTAAISQAVEDAVAATGRSVRRVAGPTRFHTAAAFAAERGPSEVVFAASGLRFPDALAAAPIVRGRGLLVLLGDGALPAPSAEVAASSGATRAVVVGGQQAVPLAAEAGLAAVLPVPPLN